MYNPQIKTFILVADRGSLSKAAEDLFVTPGFHYETNEHVGGPFASKTAEKNKSGN